MNILLATVLFVQPSVVALPSASVGFGQSDLSRFSSMAIVEVRSPSGGFEPRQMTLSTGPATKPCFVQSVDVVDATFAHPGRVTLVFPYNFLQDFANWRENIQLATLDVPLRPGKYFVLGRLPHEGEIAFFPGISTLGSKSGTGSNEVRTATLQGDIGELAVFTCVITEQERIVRKTGSGAVLESLLDAAYHGTTISFDAMDLILRTNNMTYPEWRSASATAANRASILAAQAIGAKRALLYLVAYSLGKSENEKDVYASLVASEELDSAWWSTEVGRVFLSRYSTVSTREDDDFARWRGSVERQIFMIDLLEQAGPKSQEVIARKLSNVYDSRMREAISRIVSRTEGSSGAARPLLTKLPIWFSKPEWRPSGTSAFPGRAAEIAHLNELLMHWRSYLGT